MNPDALAQALREWFTDNAYVDDCGDFYLDATDLHALAAYICSIGWNPVAATPAPIMTAEDWEAQARAACVVAEITTTPTDRT